MFLNGKIDENYKLQSSFATLKKDAIMHFDQRAQKWQFYELHQQYGFFTQDLISLLILKIVNIII